MTRETNDGIAVDDEEIEALTQTLRSRAFVINLCDQLSKAGAYDVAGEIHRRGIDAGVMRKDGTNEIGVNYKVPTVSEVQFDLLRWSRVVDPNAPEARERNELVLSILREELTDAIDNHIQSSGDQE